MDYLIVEDDRSLSEAIKSSWPTKADRLKFVSSFNQSIPFIQSAELNYFDGVIVDIHLGDGSGLDLLRAIRAKANIPLVLISGSGTSESRADAISNGADDFLMKPLYVAELHARMTRLVSRRRHAGRSPAVQEFLMGRVRCDLSRKKLAFAGREMAVTHTEARLLAYLHRNRNRDCSKSQLYKFVFRREYDPAEKSLEVYISRLRNKLFHLDRESSSTLKNVRGVGYRYSELTAAAESVPRQPAGQAARAEAA